MKVYDGRFRRSFKFFFVPATNCRGSWSRRWTCVRQRPGATARLQRNSRREYHAVVLFEYSNMQSTWTFYCSHRAARRTLKHLNTQLGGYKVLRSKYSICWSHNTKKNVCRIHSNRRINSIIWYDKLKFYSLSSACWRWAMDLKSSLLTRSALLLLDPVALRWKTSPPWTQPVPSDCR